MPYQIVSHTPYWVWALLLGLLWLGLAQAAPRRASLGRVVLLPVVMTGLSLHGTLSVFGTAPLAWVLWLASAVATMSWSASNDLPRGARYEAMPRVFVLPGSWVPMGLLLAVFATRYAVGVALALNPALTQDPGTAATVASVYGALSGAFMGRMLCLLRLARKSRQEQVDRSTVAWN